MHILSSMTRAVRATFVSSAVVLGSFGASVSTPVLADAPMVKTQAPGYFRMMLGDFEVTAVSDGTVLLPMDQLLHQPAAKTKAAVTKAHLTLPIETSVNAYLVNTGSKLVLVDAGAGGLFGPTLGKLIDNIRAAGYTPEQVDDIVITHMHPDHIGGVAAQGSLAFPNATVHADKRESDFWLSQSRMDAAPAASKGFFQGAMASLNPYIAAGKYKPFEADGEIVPGVRSVAAPGHTEGHTLYAVESKGQKLLLMGDLIHVGAVQFDHMGVTIAFDTDEPRAAKARAKVFAQAAKDGIVVGASHLQFPGLGYLQAAGKGYRWIPVNYGTLLK